MQKSLIFRVDASIKIGTGHVYRCLTLANKLKFFFKIYFVCRETNGNLILFIKNKGYDIFVLPKSDLSSIEFNENVECNEHAQLLEERWDIDAKLTVDILKNIKNVEWLIVDHYSIDQKWENLAKKFSSKLMVIDDLNDRKHTCDILLDPNYSKTANDYLELVPNNCKLLIGDKYNIIRDEFIQLRCNSLKRRLDPKLSRVLIFMGGADEKNVTSKILRIISDFPLFSNIKIDVIVGISSPWFDDIKKLAKKFKHQIVIWSGVENLAEFFVNADLAILAAGGTFWEACYMGLPSILVSTAENQSKLFGYISNINLPILSNEDRAFKIKLNTFLKEMLINNEFLESVSINMQEIISQDGSNLIVNEICQHS
jgi:UDP-2,4-diacetamido-2,4,6-trideoxy-beta-L-altropyranose hydrolase